MKKLKKDILKTYNLATGTKLKKILSCYGSPGVHAVINIRFGQWINSKNIFIKILLKPMYYIQYRFIRTNWGIDIPCTTKIKEGFYIGHYGSIFISPHAILGKNINISQNVTIGGGGNGEEFGYPTLGDNIYIAPGAKIFGKINIGNNVKIGANSVVYKNIPSDTTVILKDSMHFL